jgi:asparagine synthase (glutamine-hydrolysing)
MLSRGFREEMAGVDPIADMAQRIGLGRLAGLGPVSAHQYYGFKADLAGYILVCLGDRAEMAHSLEGRVPFLDHKLVEFACTLPANLKVRDGATKYLLRESMKGRTAAAADRRKRPFMAPSAETLGLDRGGAQLGRYLERRVIKDVGLFDPLMVAALRQAIRFLPARSYAFSLAETLLTIVASTHVLHELFCDRFEDSVRRFSAPVDDRATLAHAQAPAPVSAG